MIFDFLKLTKSWKLKKIGGSVETNIILWPNRIVFVLSKLTKLNIEYHWDNENLFKYSKIYENWYCARIKGKRMNDWLLVCVKECLNEWMNEWMNEQMNEWVSEQCTIVDGANITARREVTEDSSLYGSASSCNVKFTPAHIFEATQKILAS